MVLQIIDTMKKLEPKNQPEGIRPPVLYGDDRLRQDIRDFVGEGGYIPITEHGYQPSINAYAVDENGILLRHPIGREKRRRIEFTEMDEAMLKNVILELFRYMNWCHLYA